MHKQQLKALVVIVALFSISFGTIIFFTDTPVSGRKKKGSWGAIAIRDNVNAFQKMGTCLFTRNYLSSRYDHSFYYTQDTCNEHREDFVEKLTQLLQEHDSVDIFLLSHTNYYYEWVSLVDPALRKKIHLVYNTGCSGLFQAEEWQRLGISHYIGHRSERSISPVFYFYFLRRYLTDRALLQAVAESNASMHEKLARIERASLGSVYVYDSVEKNSEGVLFTYK